ncbi:MAG: polysaccharide deacetylase family protein [Acidobacteriia bacterium]|nr:polysaccharide deacetylase family protein [Terriglobia bacterium]
MRIGSVPRHLLIAGLAATMAAIALPRGAAQTPERGRSVAITLDDGPVVNELKDLANFQRIAGRLREALVAEKVPATIFINERQLNVQGQRDGRAEVLAQWLDAGYDLGNHTYSHPSLNKIPLWQFEDDLIRGEVVMRSLLEERGRKLVWFRYPFLDSGPDAQVHQAFVDFLEQRHYRVAHITVDYKDYSFAGVYLRLLRAGNTEVAEKVKQAYLDQVDRGFEHAEKASAEVFGYELPQILLIHCNELNSVTLRESIDRMRQRGYRFVTLEEATKDPAYLRPDTFAGDGGSWLERSARAMGKQITAPQPRMPKWITDLPRAGR